MTYLDEQISGYMHGVAGNQSLSIYALHRPRAKTVDLWQRGVLLGLLAKTLAARALNSSQH